MFKLNDEQLKELGAIDTVREIEQQPEVWKEAFSNYQHKKKEIEAYMANLANKHERIRVIFAGAGTSAFVGDTVLPYLKNKINENKWELTTAPTTDIVSNPNVFFKKDIPTLLVSFARSGNSPESVATVELGKQLVNDFYQLTITCAQEGQLAQRTQGDKQNLLLLQPVRSNDKGFAMTSSFTCMLLTALLVFDTISDVEKEKLVDVISVMAKAIIDKEYDIQKIIDQDFERVIYLGSGSLASLTKEASLKILELTAGKIATLFDSSLGFRHGPKSFVDQKSLIFVFISNNYYTSQYDRDILNEVYSDKIAKNVYSITTNPNKEFEGNEIIYPEIGKEIQDGYLALPYMVFAQIFSVMASLKISNTPDTPSATGTVNRVVKGVTIYPLSEGLEKC